MQPVSATGGAKSVPGTTWSMTNEGRGCADASVYDAFRVSCNTVFAKLGADVGLTARGCARRVPQDCGTSRNVWAVSPAVPAGNQA